MIGTSKREREYYPVNVNKEGHHACWPQSVMVKNYMTKKKKNKNNK